MIPNFWGTLEVAAAELHLCFVIKGNAWWKQWRTQKIFMGFHSMAYGSHLHLVCAVCDVTIGRHITVSKPTFWRNLLTYYAYSSIRTPLNLCVTELNINSQRSRLGYRRNIHSSYDTAVHNCKNVRLRVKTGE